MMYSKPRKSLAVLDSQRVAPLPHCPTPSSVSSGVNVVQWGCSRGSPNQMAGFTCHSDLLISHLRYQEFAVGRTNNPGLVGGLDNFLFFHILGIV